MTYDPGGAVFCVGINGSITSNGECEMIKKSLVTMFNSFGKDFYKSFYAVSDNSVSIQVYDMGESYSISVRLNELTDVAESHFSNAIPVPSGSLLDTNLLRSNVAVGDFPIYMPGNIYMPLGFVNLTFAELDYILSQSSDDETRYMLCGLHFSKDHIVATNSHRLVTFDHGLDLDRPFTVPVDHVRKFIRVVKSQYKVMPALKISTCGSDYYKLSCGNVTLQGRLLDGRYPDYMAFFKDNLQYLHDVDIPECAKLLDEIVLHPEYKKSWKDGSKSTSYSHPVINVTGNEFYLSCVCQGYTIVSSSIYGHFGHDVSFSWQYFSAMVKFFDGKFTVESHGFDSHSPWHFRSGTFCQILMPMRR